VGISQDIIDPLLTRIAEVAIRNVFNK
jgi:hypothetical protein